MNSKIRLWNHFCQENKIFEEGVPLFETNGLTVFVFPYGQNGRMVLKRSEQMDNLVISEVNKVIDDFNAGTNRYEGLLYMMFWRDGDRVLPLYIGKSEKYGLDGKKLSANISHIEQNQGKFCRWGYNYAYHIGDLSAIVCPGHPKEKGTLKYLKWADTLFCSFPIEKPQLKQQTYFWTTAWQYGSIGPWKEYGPTSLTLLEYLLIGMASDCFPKDLLNKEGVVRK